jgi:hypothetical protein
VTNDGCFYCTACGSVGWGKRVTPGSFGIEAVLWLLLIVPGLIYSVWRLASRHNACAVCGSKAIIPSDSPIARAVLAQPPVAFRRAPVP